MQDPPTKISSQFPGFRLTVARQMADYRRRMADRVAQERERQSLSRDALAYRAGVSGKTIKRVEEMKTDPRPVTVRRIAEGLGIDPVELRPPPEMEEQHLERLEARLDAIMEHLGISLPDLEPAADSGSAEEAFSDADKDAADAEKDDDEPGHTKRQPN